MHVRTRLDSDAEPAAVYPWLFELDHYAAWLDIVAEIGREAGSDPAAWNVVLQARIGPLKRSKRLRMVRTGFDDDRWVRFERRESDGRDHSSWQLDAHLEPRPGGSTLTVELDYGGRLWSPPVERLLHAQIESGKTRFAELVSANPGGPPEDHGQPSACNGGSTGDAARPSST